jgi:putative oxidoreductase
MAEEKIPLGTVKMLRIIKKILTHKYLALVFRLYIGGLFIYASMYKINYTAEFAEAIVSYQIVPYWAVNIMAVILPWVELICGILLVAGIRARSAAFIIVLLLTLFTFAILINLLKDAPISCGCFHAMGDKISWWSVLRDLIWVVMTAHVFFYDKAFQLGKRFSLSIKEI